jgi:hypothetical protein
MQAITKYIVSFFLVPLLMALYAPALIFESFATEKKLRFKNKVSMSCFPPEVALTNHIPYQATSRSRDRTPPQPLKPEKHKDDIPGSCPHQTGSCAAAICEREKFSKRKKS